MYNVFRTTVLAALFSIATFGVLPVTIAAGQPEYAKWGEIAMQQTSARYHAAIVDYSHVGRTHPAPGIAEEKFKLWLRENNREYGVYVTIQFYTSTEQIIAIRFQETPR